MDAFTWVFSLLIPIMMVVFGLLMWKKPPKEINGIMGYRTRRSMINQQTWDFAHHHVGKNWTLWGSVLLGASVLALLFVPAAGDTILLTLTFVQLAVLIISIFPTEAALKRKFDDYGFPRE